MRGTKPAGESPLHTRFDGKEVALPRRRVQVFGGHGEARRGDVERVERGPAKGAARRPRAGQFDDSVDFSTTVQANEAAAAHDTAVP